MTQAETWPVGATGQQEEPSEGATPARGSGPDPDRGRRPSGSLRRRLAVHTGVFVWCLLVAAYATWPLAVHAGTHVMGNLGDPLEIAWRLAWDAHALAHQPLHLFDANMLHPEPATLAYSENHLGVALPVAPVFWLSGNALLTYNAEILLVLAAGGFGAYLLTREASGSWGAALVAGTAYTAVPFRVSMAGLGHVHVLAVHFVPVILLVLLRLRRPRSWPRVVLLGGLVAASWWSSFTGAFMTMATIGTWAAWEAVARRRRAWPVLWRAAAGTAAGLVAAAPVLWPYLELRRHHPEYRHADIELIDLSATAGSYLHAPPGGLVVRPAYRVLADEFRPATAAGEKELFPGFFLLGAGAATAGAAVVVAVRRRRRPAAGQPAAGQPVARLPGAEAAGLLAAVGVTGLVLSFGPHYGARPDGVPMPFAVLNALTPGALMRAPARMGALALLALAVLAGIGLSWARPHVRRLLVGGSLALLLVEFMPIHISLVEAPPRTAAHRAVAGRPGAVLGLPTIEYDDRGALIVASLPRESQHMYLSTEHFRPITNGWGAYYPEDAFTFARAVADVPSPGAFAAMRARDVRTVVVQTNLTPGTRWAGVEDLLAGWPGVRVVARGRGVVVYDVSAVR